MSTIISSDGKSYYELSAKDSAEAAAFVVGIPAFAPILVGAIFLGLWLHNSTGINPLFAILSGIATASTSIWLVISIPVVRIIYSILCTLTITTAVFLYSIHYSDLIWSVFFGLVVLGIGAWITRSVAKRDFWGHST